MSGSLSWKSSVEWVMVPKWQVLGPLDVWQFTKRMKLGADKYETWAQEFTCHMRTQPAELDLLMPRHKHGRSQPPTHIKVDHEVEIHWHIGSGVMVEMSTTWSHWALTKFQAFLWICQDKTKTRPNGKKGALNEARRHAHNGPQNSVKGFAQDACRPFGIGSS